MPLFPGEEFDIKILEKLGEKWGYGRCIQILQEAWSKKAVKNGIPEVLADMEVGIICVWCDTDHRTGKKVKWSKFNRKGKKVKWDIIKGFTPNSTLPE